ncbi:E-selectin [Holothuria leucospilota]|uniref:E-selectin n=1 Tax=Holothuria leucospilota TaxID=206669 RepID=A0A9Q1H532_HOLLE|nr:E-selectin [Holothuria leucospilota]
MKNLVTFFCLLSFGVTVSKTTIQKGYVVTPLGCFVDAANDNDRVLKDYGGYVPSITIEKCEEKCLSFNENISLSLYFGLEDGRMCFCGKESNYSRYGPSTNCTLPCDGNKTQICGGHHAISVYQFTSTPCGQMILLANGYVNLTDNNTAASIGCLHGYQLRGPKLIQCNLSSSEWDIPMTPSCVRKSGKCKKLENPLNGTVYQDDNQANFSCDQSYVLDGESVLSCLPTGNWSTDPPDCISEQYSTTMIGTNFDVTTDTMNEVFGLPIYLFTSLLLVAIAVLIVVIIILINLIVKTTTETKRIKKFKTDSTYAEQRSRGQENNESFWKSSPDMLKTSKSVDN